MKRITCLLWDDNECTSSSMYEFQTVNQYRFFNRKSINASLHYLRQHVWCTYIPGRSYTYGFRSKQFVRDHFRKFNRSVEKTLRHSVEYWKANLAKRIECDALVNLVLCTRVSADITQHIKTFLFIM